MKKILLPLALMSALLVSCEKPENKEPEPEPNPEYVISVSPAELTFGAEGGEQTIKVTSTYGEESDFWSVYAEEGWDWCDFSSSYGENGEEVTVTVEPYDNPDETRTATFTFTCGDKEADLIITQEAKVYSISTEPTELTFEVEGGEAEVLITSSDDWEIGSLPDWIDVSEEYGENGATIIVTAEYNVEVESRSGEIVFTCGNKETKISVTQKADDSPIIQFKDPYFLDALLETYEETWNDVTYYIDVDKNNDGQISEREASIVEILVLSTSPDAERAIRNVDELSHFTSLRYLNLANASIESIDLSGLSELECLEIRQVELKSLDVSKNTALTSLSCYRNQLTSLDVSKNTALTSLSCGDNQLTTLDVSKNTALTSLGCGGNQLTSLDVSKNTALTSLSCDDNQLTSLDVSKNTALTFLYCYRNQLTSLDLSKNTALADLNCDDNQLTSLDVSGCTALTYLYCSSNQLTFLDLHNNKLLEELRLYDNPLQKLILYKYHIIKDFNESAYGDIIEYME